MSSQIKPSHSASDTNSLRDRIFYLVFPLLALMSPIIGNLNSIMDTLYSGASYVDSTEPLLIFIAGLAVFYLLIGLFIAGLDFAEKLRSKRITLLKHFFIAGIVFIALDLSYGVHQITTSLMPFDVDLQILKIWRIVCVVIALTALYMLCRLLSDHLAVILVSVFGAVFISSVVIHMATGNKDENIKYATSKGHTDLPPVIHIVLDEMIGTEGIDREIPGGEKTYQLVRKFHERFNFRLYGKAFSRHFWTTMSIPNMLNYDYTDETYGNHSKYLSQKKFLFFDDMRNRGYDINVYQTSHVNFCTAGNIVRCQTLNSFNPASIYIPPPESREAGTPPKNAIIFSLILQKAEGSHIARLGRKIMKLVDTDAYFAERFDVQSFKLWFDNFSSDVASTEGGKVFFAHFLIPHAPFILNPDCDTKPISWQHPYYLKEVKKLSGETFQEARKGYYLNYFEQVSCVYNKLTEFMETIENLKQFKDSTIIITGDHGSRISSGQFYENLSDQDYVDNFSALFSVRSPKVEPGYDLKTVSTQRLFAELFNRQYSETSTAKVDTVAVDSEKEGHVISAPMPDFGQAPSQTKR